MNKHLHQTIDQLGLMLLHRIKSASSHFRTATDFPVPVDDRNKHQFYPKPGIPDMTFQPVSSAHKDQSYRGIGCERGSFRFPSQILTGDRRNDTCSGEYRIPSRTAEGQAYVLFIHGWRMNSYDRLKKLFEAELQRTGYPMFYLNLPYHLEREPEHSGYSGELLISADVERTLQAVRQAVSDIRALIRYIKEVRKGKVILVGLSLGGLFANLTAALEKDVDLLISLFYANSLSYLVWNAIPGKYIKRDLLAHGYSYPELQRFWTATEPSAYSPAILKERMLLISGAHDLYVPKADSDRLWESWGKPRRLVYPCGHAGIAFQEQMIRRDVMAFLRDQKTP